MTKGEQDGTGYGDLDNQPVPLTNEGEQFRVEGWRGTIEAGPP